MDISILNDYMCVAAVVAAWVIAEIIKKIFKGERVKDFIPLICAIVGVIVMLAVDIPTGNFSVYTIIVGLVSGWSATGVYETVMNIVKPKLKAEPSSPAEEA